MTWKGYTREQALSAVGEGWAHIVGRLYDLSEKYSVVVVQVKEKFGGLRFYTGALPENAYTEIMDTIREGEEESLRICEWCGAPGELDTSLHWVLTLCGRCAEERRSEYAARWQESKQSETEGGSSDGS